MLLNDTVKIRIWCAMEALGATVEQRGAIDRVIDYENSNPPSDSAPSGILTLARMMNLSSHLMKNGPCNESREPHWAHAVVIALRIAESIIRKENTK